MLTLSPIQSRALMLGLLPAALLAVVLITYVIFTRLADLEESYQARGTAYARELAALGAHLIEADEPVILAQIIDEAMAGTDMVSVQFHDNSGKLFIERKVAGLTQNPDAFTDSFSAPAKHNMPPDGSEISGRVTVHLTSPVHFGNQTRIIFVTLIIGISVLLITAIIALALARRVTRPLQRLTSAVRQLEHGELQVKVPVVSRGELGMLEEGFNAMANRLRQARQDLEGQVDQATEDLMETMEALEIRNVELDLARKRALEASRAKSEFLANMSHEIRTPMNGVLGFANLLRKTDMDSVQKDFLHNIVASASSLLDIINDILDFSKLEAGKIQLDASTFRLRNCLEDAVALLAPQAHDKHLELTILIYDDVPDSLVGDATRLRQILINLLGNAIKFTHEGEIAVRVMLDAETDSEATLCMSVSDTGIGVPAKVKERLFKAFDQGAENVQRIYGGTGLGLAITSKLAEAMHGNVEVDSEEGTGSTFTVGFTLPKAPQAAEYHTQRSLTDSRIALFDSHRLSGLALYHRLSGWGATVQRCEDKDQLAACVTADENFQAVILGLSAGQSEEEQNALVEECRKHCHKPILALVSSSNGERIEQLKSLGAHQCLSKPAPGHFLYRTLNTLLVKQRTANEPSIGGSKPLPPRPSLTHLRVLAADDNEINLRLVAQLLAATGADVTQARDGREVLERVMEQHFDLALLDIHMPQVNGLEAARNIRATPGKTAELPLIALTADAAPQNRDRILGAGFDDYMVKPLDESRLWHIIRRLIHGGRDVNAGEQESLETPENDMRETEAPAVRDEAAAIRAAGGNAELAAELFAAFLRDLLPQFEEIRRLQSEGNWTDLRETAHRVHGSTAYCGVPALKLAVKNLEKAAERGNSDEIAELADRMENEIQKVVEINSPE